MQVTILGCGPSGLVAAHAAVQRGHDVTILSRKRKSEMFGAQYLHAPIPGATNCAPRHVKVVLNGTHDEYRFKVYGSRAAVVPSVSTEDLPPDHSAWNIRETYDTLWEMYSEHIHDQDISAEVLDAAGASEPQEGRLVVSTIPLNKVCRTHLHMFSGQAIWALGDAPERGIFVRDMIETLEQVREGTILCNGKDSPSWYRAASVFGRVTVEWPFAYLADSCTTPYKPGKPPAKGASLVQKPIYTTCDCWPGLLRAGRYGQWTKGVLVHHVYQQVLDALDKAES